MNNGIKIAGIIVVFVMIFMVTLMWKANTSNELNQSITKIDNNAVSNRIDGYILLKGDTVFFIEEKHIKDDYDRKNLEERLKRRIPADAILHFNYLNIEKELQTGDKVRIECSEILESYPAKVRVTKLEKIQD
ncbi:DUF3221 domain-containing protein [Bacillus sp. 123MFChir2]|uniref:DUF3221 domain-containing protein n=1 Tax=Bacillus sp. 123MFChir2 TaxID=1169144 RepID=UPI00037BD418|nr:DUF3221 domain-containing protein [Bacillus sp. 123MFChir2]